MTFFEVFLLGIVAGFAVGAPYGPSGTLSLYRSIQNGWRVGMVTAVGSLLAIFVFSFISAFLISYLLAIFQDKEFLKTIRLVMGIALSIIGVPFIYSNLQSSSQPRIDKENKTGNDLIYLLSAFGVGLVSGKNVIGFPAFLISSRYISDNDNPTLMEALIFSCGAALSSSLLYFLLVTMSVRWGSLVFGRILPFMKYVVALIFIGLGLWLIIGYFR